MDQPSEDVVTFRTNDITALGRVSRHSELGHLQIGRATRPSTTISR